MILLALLLTLAGAGLHSCEPEEKEKNADVKYKGPVVYTNLPPPVLYFPNFPSKPQITNRESADEAEDKRVEYVPFPYKDLPLLVYQSDSQPPVHVVENKAANSEQTNQLTSAKSPSSAGYQTAPAVYQIANQGQSNQQQYENLQQSMNTQPQNSLNVNKQYVNLNQLDLPEIDPQNQQYISIGVSQIQQLEGLDVQQNPTLHSIPTPASQYQQQTHGMQNQMQYIGQQQGSPMHQGDQMQYVGQQQSSQMQYGGPQKGSEVQYGGQQQSYQMQYGGQQQGSQMQYEGQQQNAQMQYEGQQQNAQMQYEGQQQNAQMQYGGQQPNSQGGYTMQNVASPPPQSMASPVYYQAQNMAQYQQPLNTMTPNQYAGQQSTNPQLTPEQLAYLIRNIRQQIQAEYSGEQKNAYQSPPPQQQMHQPSMENGNQLQHLGIAISTIQSPPPSSAQQSYGVNSQSKPEYSQQAQQTNEQDYDQNDPQYVSIGVYPYNTAEKGYEQEDQQYYVVPAQSIEYGGDNQKLNSYMNQNQNKEKVPESMNSNTPAYPVGQVHQNSGYQYINIDLSSIRNQNSKQNAGPNYGQQMGSNMQKTNTGMSMTKQSQGKEMNKYKAPETEYQHILIHIPHNEPEAKNQQKAEQEEITYAGTAQVPGYMEGSNKERGMAMNKPGNSYRKMPPRYPSSSAPYAAKMRTPQERPQQAPAYTSYQQGSRPRLPENYKAGSTNKASHAIPFNNMNNHRRPRPFVRHPGPRLPNQRPAMVPDRNRMSIARQVYNKGPDISVAASSFYPQSAVKEPFEQNFEKYSAKPVVPHLGGHPGIYASSTMSYTSVNPGFAKRPSFSPLTSSTPFHLASSSLTHSSYVPSTLTSSLNSVGPETVISESYFQPTAEKLKTEYLTSANTNDNLNFDEINEFLSPSDDLFGSSNQEKTKLENENLKQVLQMAEDISVHEHDSLLSGFPVTPQIKTNQVPNTFAIPQAPLAQNYWAYPPRPFGFPVYSDPIYPQGPGAYYGPIRHPIIPGHRNAYPYIRGQRGNIRPRKRGLMGRLAALGNPFSLRNKSKKISAREEIKDDSDIKDSESTVEAILADMAAPRSTVIKSNRRGLDGVSIPLKRDHTFMSRSSSEIQKESDPKPPIIVYKGSKPPLEIYGTKEDIENVTKQSTNDTEDDLQTSATEHKSVIQKDTKGEEKYSGQSLEYLELMYSMLPDFIKDTMVKRNDDESSRWLPIELSQYAPSKATGEISTERRQKHEDSEKEVVTEELLKIKDSAASQNSSIKHHPSSIQEDIEELFSNLGREEKSDILSA